MKQYIDLNRKFKNFDPDATNEQDNLVSNWNATITWEDVLKYQFVVILAEGRAGKTTELRLLVTGGCIIGYLWKIVNIFSQLACLSASFCMAVF